MRLRVVWFLDSNQSGVQNYIILCRSTYAPGRAHTHRLEKKKRMHTHTHAYVWKERKIEGKTQQRLRRSSDVHPALVAAVAAAVPDKPPEIQLYFFICTSEGRLCVEKGG